GLPTTQGLSVGPVLGPLGRVGAMSAAADGPLAEPPSGGLPPPVDLAQFFVFVDEQRPDHLEQIDLDPSLKGAMESRIISIDSRDMIPLATSAELEDQSVKNFSVIFTRSTSLFGRIILVNQFRDSFPKVIRNFPNRWYAFMLRQILDPPCALSMQRG